MTSKCVWIACLLSTVLLSLFAVSGCYTPPRYEWRADDYPPGTSGAPTAADSDVPTPEKWTAPGDKHAHASPYDAPEEAPVVIFDGNVKATHVAYVVDRSDATSGNWRSIQQELFKSIGALSPEQDFALVLMGQAKPVSYPDTDLITARKQYRAQAAKLLLDTEANAQTDPAAAVRKAFALLATAGPEGRKVLLLITDRPFIDRSLVALVAELNQKQKARVITFLYGKGNIQTAEVLGKIATQNHGTFRNVGASEE